MVAPEDVILFFSSKQYAMAFSHQTFVICGLPHVDAQPGTLGNTYQQEDHFFSRDSLASGFLVTKKLHHAKKFSSSGSQDTQKRSDTIVCSLVCIWQAKSALNPDTAKGKLNIQRSTDTFLSAL
jgi:hypothetical protein